MITENQLVDYLKNVNLRDLNTLITRLEDELGVTAAPPAMVPFGIPGDVDNRVVEEKTEFDLILTGLGDGAKKVAVIKAVRTLTGLGLKEAKAIVDNAPSPLKEGISKAEVEAAADVLKEAGATVEVK